VSFFDRASWNQVTDVSEQNTNKPAKPIDLAGEWAFVRSYFTHTTTPSGCVPGVSNCQGLWAISPATRWFKEDSPEYGELEPNPGLKDL